MCPVHRTQSVQKVHLLGSSSLSLLISGHAVCTVTSLQCTHAGAAISWAVTTFMDDVCDKCVKSLGLSVVSCLKLFAFLQCFRDSSGSWANPNPNLIHRLSHLTRPVIRGVIPVAKSAKYSHIPSTLVNGLSIDVVNHDVNWRAEWSSKPKAVASCNLLDIVKCQLVNTHSSYPWGTCTIECQRQWKSTEANRTFW